MFKFDYVLLNFYSNNFGTHSKIVLASHFDIKNNA